MFGGLPDRTRLLRLLGRHRGLCQRFLATAGEWVVLDSYAIELVHPARYRQRRHPLGYKRRDQGSRFLIGVRSAWLVTPQGTLVNWGWQPLATPRLS